MADQIYSYKEYLEKFEEIADAIRAQTGDTASIRLVDMPTKIAEIPNATGGLSRELNITDANFANHSTYFPSSGYTSSYKYFTKVNLNITDPVNLSADTVAADKLVEGITAHDSQKTLITGTIPIKDSNAISLQGDVVAVQRGYYENDTTKLIEPTPVATPSISVSSDGLVSVTSNQLSGYVVAENQTIFRQLPTENDKIFIPTSSDQIAVMPGKYTVGNIKVKGDPNLVSTNIKGGTSIFGIEGDPALVDTTDSNATINDIKAGKTCYVNGSKLTGVYDPFSVFTGTEETHTVYPGNTITIGDIVSIYGNGDYEYRADTLLVSNSAYTPAYTPIVLQMSINKAMIIYTASASNSLYGVLLTINEDYSITVSQAKYIDATTNGSYSWATPTAVKLSDTKLVVFYSNNSYYLYGIVINVSGTTFSMGPPTLLNATSNVAYLGSKCALKWSDTKIVLCYCYTANYYAACSVVTVSDMNLSIGNIACETNYTNAMYNSWGGDSARVFRINSTTVALISANNNDQYQHAFLFSINGTTTAYNNYYQMDSSYYSGYGAGMIQLDDTHVLWIGAYNTSYYLYARLYTFSSTSITCVATQLSTTANLSQGGVHICPLGNNRYLITHSYSSNTYETIITATTSGVSVFRAPVLINNKFTMLNPMSNSGYSSTDYDLLVYRDASNNNQVYGKVIFHAPFVRSYAALAKVGVALQSGGGGDAILVKVNN